MSEILVVVDHVAVPEGVAIKKPTYEMLTLAARIGEASAVFIGPRAEGRRSPMPSSGTARSGCTSSTTRV
ncbi:hypothetical protein ACKI1I_44305 [Streptomyces turgidiscabies]|uniref:Uncharacterized protein n=1 Tax=Streptomyces turgidiscabies (strain Car8) TaxID=698760 RepID=L7FBQ6_STRT8|nr:MULTISPECIES: hypothetical protein [Streptomyces]ELP68486.1 hypothetical protein STRTUCAR8_00120 [Streptomyces turgidiscabies Car8]MDX3498080.1 hypothetical protein [Streptomyces turgidiscabies]GAQ76694.1 hypothetical protein T45_08496 [Streptomyces turgidiscabies]